MKLKKRITHLYNKIRTFIPLMIISTILIVIILASLYLNSVWNKYQDMAKSESLELAQSIESLIHTEHITTLVSKDGKDKGIDEQLVEKSLVRLVESTSSIYYSYILKQEDENYFVIADSKANDPSISADRRRNCEETTEINRLPFETGQGIVTNPISSPCGNWVRAIVPIYDIEQENVMAVLGLSYSAEEWNAALWKNMTHDIIIVIFIILLIFTVFNIYRKHLNIIESERSKSVFLSLLPGMSYRCKNDFNWTMEFVSEGSYDLTGYMPEDFVENQMISYNEVISDEYLHLVRAEWERVLSQGKDYRDEYEIITKSKQRKWVMELGKGVYDVVGNIKAIEGIVIDITDRKMKEFQIADLKDHDFLTGLYNSSFMEEEIKRLDNPEFLPLSIAICDIDGLRMVNDAYGREDGDKLIIKTSRIIKSCLSGEYVLGHLGGGEFLIYLPHMDSQGAHQLKTDIKNKVDNYNQSGDNGLYTISVSIGHSTKETEEQEIEDVVKGAERYLNRRKLLNKNSSYSAIVSSIMATLYAKSHETEEHGQRLGKYCDMIGKELGLSQVELDDLQLLSKLHDIGKIGIDDGILNKPGKLSETEWKVMRQHPKIGYRIAMTTPQLKHIAEYILYHHERWDGKGYPKGVSGDNIPLISRILAIADAYDAMTEDRIYRNALPKVIAIKEIENNAGTQFDPYVAKIFIRLMKENNGIWKEEDSEDVAT